MVHQIILSFHLMMNISDKEVNICFGVEGRLQSCKERKKKTQHTYQNRIEKYQDNHIEQNIRIVQNKLTDLGLGQISYFNQF